jgi:hypothetical protein
VSGKSILNKMSLKFIFSSQVWWHMPVIPVSGRLRQKDLKFKDGQRLYFKKKFILCVNPI